MILLDTHSLIWLVAGSQRLGPQARHAIQAAWDQGTAHASSFTFWEIALLHTAGHLGLDIQPRALSLRLRSDGLQVISADDEIAVRSVELGAEGFHADPADRIIMATAIICGYRLLTADRAVTAWAQQTRSAATLDPAR